MWQCVESAVPTVNWDNVLIQEKIGEGASGYVYKACYRGLGSVDTVDVAVKFFKGEATSDGRPEDEIQVGMLICC
jgi:serine/threonine protein kinase